MLVFANCFSVRPAELLQSLAPDLHAACAASRLAYISWAPANWTPMSCNSLHSNTHVCVLPFANSRRSVGIDEKNR